LFFIFYSPFLLTFFEFFFLWFLRTKKATAYVTAIASKQKQHRYSTLEGSLKSCIYGMRFHQYNYLRQFCHDFTCNGINSFMIVPPSQLVFFLD